MKPQMNMDEHRFLKIETANLFAFYLAFICVYPCVSVVNNS